MVRATSAPAEQLERLGRPHSMIQTAALQMPPSRAGPRHRPQSCWDVDKLDISLGGVPDLQRHMEMVRGHIGGSTRAVETNTPAGPKLATFATFRWRLMEYLAQHSLTRGPMQHWSDLTSFQLELWCKQLMYDLATIKGRGCSSLRLET